jgi:hypothetical protein
MNKMIELTGEQKRAYDRYIRARNNVSLGQYRRYNKGWQPTSDVLMTIDETNLNHPLFIENDEWLEYKAAFQAWMAVEPEFRKDERMSMIRGDYGSADSWREKKTTVKEI